MISLICQKASEPCFNGIEKVKIIISNDYEKRCHRVKALVEGKFTMETRTD